MKTIPKQIRHNEKEYYQMLEYFNAINYVHKWTEEETDFLVANYEYVSDVAIASALNKPYEAVKRLRSHLGLFRLNHAKHGSPIIWHHRDDYDKDAKQFELTKARPDART